MATVYTPTYRPTIESIAQLDLPLKHIFMWAFWAEIFGDWVPCWKSNVMFPLAPKLLEAFLTCHWGGKYASHRPLGHDAASRDVSPRGQT